ncbi:MAG: glycosyltransferase family A protein [Desulfurococcaceae archaeon]
MILTLYFTKDESTFNPRSLESVINQVGVVQKIYVVSASPIDLGRYGFETSNIVIPVKQSWPVPVRVGFSFNMALRLTGEEVSRYEYLFKVDGDVVLPRDYLKSIISLNPLLAGYWQAMLISTKFFRVVLKGVYPMNYCDDSYIMAAAIARGIWPILPYKDIDTPKAPTLPQREYLYGVEYYKWGMPLPLLILHPLTRIYLKATGKMKKTQRKELKAYMWNLVGYIHASINREEKYWFHRDYGRMRILHLYHSLLSQLK